jgi:hypothetical protein
VSFDIPLPMAKRDEFRKRYEEAIFMRQRVCLDFCERDQSAYPWGQIFWIRNALYRGANEGLEQGAG